MSLLYIGANPKCGIGSPYGGTDQGHITGHITGHMFEEGKEAANQADKISNRSSFY